MKILSLLNGRSPAFSFEFFPPKTDEDATRLLATVRELKSLGPAYVSVTWGAGGGTRRKTLELVSAIRDDVGLVPMAHLTCVGAGREEIDGVLDEVVRRGVHNLLALRGDPPRGETTFVPHPDGFRYAAELVAHIRRRGLDLCLGVAGYPEKHVEAPTFGQDLDNLKRKVEAGADFVITQLFFDNADFLRFRDRVASRGVRVPLVPGLMPVTNVTQLQRFTAMCGARIPDDLLARLQAVHDDADAVARLGIEHAAAQCRGLLREGAPGIHFYTLNRSRSTAEIVRGLRGAGTS